MCTASTSFADTRELRSINSAISFAQAGDMRRIVSTPTCHHPRHRGACRRSGRIRPRSCVLPRRAVEHFKHARLEPAPRSYEGRHRGYRTTGASLVFATCATRRAVDPSDATAVGLKARFPFTACTRCRSWPEGPVPPALIGRQVSSPRSAQTSHSPTAGQPRSSGSPPTPHRLLAIRRRRASTRSAESGSESTAQRDARVDRNSTAPDVRFLEPARAGSASRPDERLCACPLASCTPCRSSAPCSSEAQQQRASRC